MGTQTKYSKNFWLTFLVATLIIAVSIITENNKLLFVEESGSFKILGGISILLSLALMKKWKPARIMLIVLVGSAAAIILLGLLQVSEVFILAYFILFLLMVLILYLLLSNPVKLYLGIKKGIS